MRITWLHPDIVAAIEAALLGDGRRSWQALFEEDEVRVVARPPALEVPDAAWPRVMAHVARAGRVREVIANEGLAAAIARFLDSPHAIERAALIEAWPEADVPAIAGLLSSPLDDLVVYGQFLTRLLEAGLARDRDATVAAFERFVARAAAHASDDPSWPERVRAARDGLASLYARVGRAADADAAYEERFAEEETDTVTPLTAARVFLEVGDTGRAVKWLDHGVSRARAVGREDLASRLEARRDSLRARMARS